MSTLTNEFKEFMADIVKSTMEYREQNHVTRKDFIELLMELRKTGKVSNDDGEAISNMNAETKPLSIEQCAAQVGLFYLAGFDTTASTTSYCLFELSRKPDIMKRVQSEIDETMAKHDNAITYENIKEMTFLDLCVRGKNTFNSW